MSSRQRNVFKVINDQSVGQPDVLAVINNKGRYKRQHIKSVVHTEYTDGLAPLGFRISVGKVITNIAIFGRWHLRSTAATPTK